MKPAFYALERGGWRDYVTLLHVPYTAWHLSYVVVGGCLAAPLRLGVIVAIVAGIAAGFAAESWRGKDLS